jgi:hypothetical protein
VFSDGTKNNPASAATVEIQPGTAFFITNAVSSPGNFVVRQQDKSATSNINVYSPVTQQPQLYTSLYFYDTEHGRRIADANLAMFDSSYSAGIDDYDALHMTNMDEDIALMRNGQKLSIERRPLIVASDTLFLFMQHMLSQSYEWQFNGNGLFDPSLTAVLVDNYLGTQTSIDLTNPAVIPFTVNTSIAGSKASNRFYIVFGKGRPLPVTLSSIRAYQHNTGINVDWSVSQQLNMDKYEVEKSLTGINFNTSGTIAATSTTGSENYSWFDATPNIGANFYRIKMIDNNGVYTYSQVVKVVIARNEAISIYPNPVTGNTITLQMTNMDKGTYNITLTNKLGQLIYSKQLSHQGGSATQTLELTQKLPQGIYQLRVDGQARGFTIQVMGVDN